MIPIERKLKILIDCNWKQIVNIDWLHLKNKLKVLIEYNKKQIENIEHIKKQI